MARKSRRFQTRATREVPPGPGQPPEPPGAPPRRRGLIAGIAAAVILVLAGVAWRYGLPASPSDGSGPVILISIDTLRADRLPAYGYEGVQTPAIDALAKEGIVFERAYTHAPQTLPAHLSLLSGQLPFVHGVRDNIGFAAKDGQWMLQQGLREAGFATGAMVSSYVLRKDTGLAQGFDVYDSELPAASPDTPIAGIQRDGMDTLAAAEKWLDTRRSSRLFLFFHIYEPHTPYAPPERFSRYDPYDGEIAYADEIVGRLVAALRDRDLYEGATIILLSDHGEGLGDHNELEHGVFLYNETIHVPLIVKMPGGRHGGRRVDQPVQHIDLAPTVLDLTGAGSRPELAGRSLRPLLDQTGAIVEQGIFSEALYPRYHFGWSELYALTDARYRMIRAPRDELYDLQNDPRERANLAGERPQTVQAMRLAVERLLAGAAIEAPAAVSAEQREQFQALGYVGMQAHVDPAVRGETLPDPKDKVDVLRRYRESLDLAGAGRFAEAATVIEAILADNPSMADVWQQFGNLLVRLDRLSDATHAYKKFVELKPAEPGGLIMVGAVLLKQHELAEAERHASLAASLAQKHDRKSQAGAYELLAKIALKRKDREAALRYARQAEQADPTLPMPSYMQGLIEHAEGRYEQAWPYFEEALRQAGERGITMSELHFHAGDTLARLGRNAEAEAQFQSEIKLSPDHVRARSSLAMLYRSEGRDGEAERMIVEMLRQTPTPESYALAARLWEMFGDPQRAASVRALAQRQFGSLPESREGRKRP